MVFLGTLLTFFLHYFREIFVNLQKIRTFMNKKILRLAVPSIISNITVPLLGLVDVAITGHMDQPHYMAAIAVCSMLFNIIYWLFSFLRFGVGGITAQQFGRETTSVAVDGGEGKENGVSLTLLKGLITSTAVALVIIALQGPLYHLLMSIIAPKPYLMGIIRSYYDICIWGTIPSLALFVFTGWYVGMQNTRLPMLISITQNVVNIALSTFFVYGMHMKIEGVALGTLMAQWCGALMAAMLLWLRYRPLFRGISLRSLCAKRGEGSGGDVSWSHFLAVNRIIFYRTLFLVAVNLYFIVAGARGGHIALAVNSVLMQMFILFSYVMDGFAFAAEALCGRYLGAQDAHNFRLALRGVWHWSIALTVVYTIVYAFGGEPFLRLLTNDATIRHAALEYMPWAILIPVCGLAAFVWDGVFVGITHTRGMLCGTASGAFIFFAIYISLYPLLANHALWLAFLSYLLMRGITQTIIWWRWSLSHNYVGKKKV